MAYTLYVFVMLLAVLAYIEISSLKKRVRTLKEKVDALAQASGCADLALGFVPEDVRERAQALKANERSVEAVKVVREATGMSLVEAKKFVDAL